MGMKELQKDYKRTLDYLEENGSRIRSLGDIQEFGDLIAVISNIGGFYAFRTSGFNKVSRHETTFYDADLKDKSPADGPLKSIDFTYPEKCYSAIFQRSDNSYSLDDMWFPESSAGNSTRMFVGEGTLERGIYRITSKDLVTKIRDAFSDNSKKVIS